MTATVITITRRIVMYRMNFLLLACILSCLTVAGFVYAQDDPAPEASPEAPVQSPAAVTPAPVALIAGMTVDEIMKSINAPILETYRGAITEAVTGAIVIINRNGLIQTVRLYGVDSPEPGQSYHQECRQFIMDRFLGDGMNISVVATDNQANPVVLVFNSNGESLNHLMVAYGMAWWDRLNAKKDALLRRLNAEAISNSVGLYADPTSLARGIIATATVWNNLPIPWAAKPPRSLKNEPHRPPQKRRSRKCLPQKAP
jgi:endonuclease YncB( thermonuclease family)